ncbi:MAG: hypothetical protein IJJ23_10450 [Clostridia bacterium]|nr:hypothetical protein [Clostridia bacterium]
MSIFDELGKRVSTLAQSAQKQFDAAKLQRQINDKESEREGIYAEIGKLYYSCRQRNAMPDEAIATLCEKLTALGAEMDELRRRIDVISEIVRCPSCQSIVIKGSTYCSKCGAKLPEGLFDAEKSAAEENSTDEEAAADEMQDDVDEAVSGLEEEVSAAVEKAEDLEKAAGEAADEMKRQAQQAADEAEQIAASDETANGPEY